MKNLRESLDNTIGKLTGEDYQGLKDQYGALKSIEKDVAKRSVILDRQGGNATGLGKYVDIFSGGDMVHGIMSLNPALFAKGAAQSAISKVFQYINSPDRAIKGMFNAVEDGNRTAPNMQGGFIKNPFANEGPAAKIPDSVAGTMADYVDQKLSEQGSGNVHFDLNKTANLEEDAQRIAKDYKIVPKKGEKLEDAFSRILNQDKGESASKTPLQNKITGRLEGSKKGSSLKGK